MDGSDFDALTEMVADARSRRRLARLLGGIVVGGPLALFGLTDVEAGKRKKKKKKKKKKGATVPPAGSGAGSGTGSATVSPPPPCVPTCPAGTVCGSDGCDGVCGVFAGTDDCSDGICCPQEKQKSCGTDPRTQAEVCDCCGQGQHLSCEFDSAM